jgi:hypothetical protein
MEREGLVAAVSQLMSRTAFTRTINIDTFVDMLTRRHSPSDTLENLFKFRQFHLIPEIRLGIDNEIDNTLSLHELCKKLAFDAHTPYIEGERTSFKLLQPFLPPKSGFTVPARSIDVFHIGEGVTVRALGPQGVLYPGDKLSVQYLRTGKADSGVHNSNADTVPSIDILNAVILPGKFLGKVLDRIRKLTSESTSSLQLLVPQDKTARKFALPKKLSFRDSSVRTPSIRSPLFFNTEFIRERKFSGVQDILGESLMIEDPDTVAGEVRIVRPDSSSVKSAITSFATAVFGGDHPEIQRIQMVVLAGVTFFTERFCSRHSAAADFKSKPDSFPLSLNTYNILMALHGNNETEVENFVYDLSLYYSFVVCRMLVKFKEFHADIDRIQQVFDDTFQKKVDSKFVKVIWADVMSHQKILKGIAIGDVASVHTFDASKYSQWPNYRPSALLMKLYDTADRRPLRQYGNVDMITGEYPVPPKVEHYAATPLKLTTTYSLLDKRAQSNPKTNAFPMHTESKKVVVYKKGVDEFLAANKHWGIAAPLDTLPNDVKQRVMDVKNGNVLLNFIKDELGLITGGKFIIHRKELLEYDMDAISGLLAKIIMSAPDPQKKVPRRIAEIFKNLEIDLVSRFTRLRTQYNVSFAESTKSMSSEDAYAFNELVHKYKLVDVEHDMDVSEDLMEATEE